jgi:hypothetical protein
LDEQQTVQLDRARDDARFWQSMADMAADDIEGHKELLASTQQAISDREKASADFVTHAQSAKDRLAKVERGEAVPIPAPMTRKDLLRISGMTEARARHCERVAEIAEQGEHWFQTLQNEQARRRDQANKTVVRRLHRLMQQVRS